MSVVNAVSMNTVIARIIRNTRVQDTSYLIDMLEWIPEAMGLMQTTTELRYEFKDVKIVFHKGVMPCDMVRLLAVEYRGHRLKTTNTEKNFRTGHHITGDTTNNHHDAELIDQRLFSSIVTPQSQGVYGRPEDIIWKTDLIPAENIQDVMCMDESPSDCYQTEPGYITTSMRDAIVRLHYKALPLDADGLPMIPDDEDYKEAICCFVRARMIGAGYDDKVFNYRELMQAFEIHAARAMGKLTMPSPDEMDARIDAMVRFIPPTNYWENFFRTDHGEKIYDYRNNF